ncbi:DUF6121 family protein [Leifsonia aquatica]|uniref:Uncharacterized protein n=2 Tax=Leifsonia aquatica TaxID=144185 RepID=U2RTZ9_LEIAQ|nr:hypothetical protein [Leifsonia aquatica]ERK72009.1 hypothetical protein N136_01675 [Leifsonia aquatica ATCC 14665]MBB2969044.1 putative RND superfamily exporter protein [Leifsonia aquatica]
MRDERAYATIVALFAAGLYLALIVAGFGLLSLATNTEVVADPAIGTLVGPIMVGAAVLALLLALIARGTRVPADRQRVSPGNALLIGLVCYLVYVVAGAVAGIAGDPSQSLRAVLFAAGQFGSWYAVLVGIAAFVVTLLYQLVLVGRFAQRGRPRWPWEGDDDE